MEAGNSSLLFETSFKTIPSVCLLHVYLRSFKHTGKILTKQTTPSHTDKVFREPGWDLCILGGKTRFSDESRVNGI